MLGAFARAGQVLGEPRFLEAAASNFRFLQANLWDPASRTLHHRWRDGARDSVPLLESYAGVLAGAIVSMRRRSLQTCSPSPLADGMLERFHDPREGGFWQAEAGASDLILRVKEAYDGAEPSGTPSPRSRC